MTTITQKPGIAVWGVGSHARRNLIPAITASGWSLAGLLSRDRAVVEAMSGEMGVRGYESAEEMLNDPAVAAVLIAGPNGVHYEQAKAVLLRGKAALVEKSLCETFSQALDLIALAEKHGVLVAECFSYVFHPQFARLRAALAAPASGRLMSITARFGFPHRDRTDIRYRADLAGGALLDIGAYCISAVSRLVPGPAKLVWARLKQPTGYAVDIEGQAVVELANGATGLCDWGMGRAYRNEIETWGDAVSIFVDRAFAKSPELETTVRITHQNGNWVETIPVEAANPFVAMLDSLESATHDASARERLRAQILDQATLMRDVRQIAAR